MGHRHTIHTLHLESGDADLVFSALRSGAHEYNYQMIGPDSGGPYMEVEFVQSLEERITAECEALATLLDNLLLTQANCIGSGKTFTELHLYGRRLDECGTDGTSAGSTHCQVKSTLARLFITTLTMPANGTAYATLQGVLLSADGVAEASTVAFNVALPSGGIVDEAFKLHGIKLAGTTLDAGKITNAVLDTGIRYTTAFGTRSRPLELAVTKTVPTLTIDTEDTSIESAFAKGGTIATHANSLIELRRRDPDTGGEVGPTAEEHIAITVAGTVRPGQPRSGSGSSTATAQLVATLTGIAGTPPITVAIDEALTL